MYYVQSDACVARLNTGTTNVRQDAMVWAIMVCFSKLTKCPNRVFTGVKLSIFFFIRNNKFICLKNVDWNRFLKNVF